MLYPHPKDEWGTLVAELTATLRELLARLYSCCRVPPVVLLEGEREKVWVGVVECGSKEPARTERIVGRIKACGHSLACCLKLVVCVRITLRLCIVCEWRTVCLHA